MIVIVIITFKPGFDQRLYKLMKNHGSILLFTKTRPHCLKRSMLIFGGGLLGLYACCLFKEEGFQVGFCRHQMLNIRHLHNICIISRFSSYVSRCFKQGFLERPHGEQKAAGKEILLKLLQKKNEIQ